MTNGMILGLDIGVASVGVGIIEADSGKIVHASSRIFPSANADNNVDRRKFRGSRRLLRRKKHRVKRLQDLFDKYDIVTNFDNLNLNPYELRVKGLNEPLSNEELFASLRNITKHRGISYLDDAEDDSSGNGTEYAKAIELNQQLLKEKTPGQIQYDRLNQYGQLRGNFDIVDENGEIHHVINVFSTSSYRKEAERILKKQCESNALITDNFINDFIQLLTSKRKYYHGPGNPKSRTDYGRYRTDGTDLDNIFDVLIGKCSFYQEEYRASKASYTAQEFNFLNDLNNLTLPTETGKLSEQQKIDLVNWAKETKILGPKKLLQEIAKRNNCKFEDIRGYRLDNKDNPDMHVFDVYRKMNFDLETISVKDLSVDSLNQLARILTLNTEREGIEEAIKKLMPNQFTEKQMLELIAFRKSNSSIFGKGWHSFSVKLMKELIPELYHTSDEQMTILNRFGKFKLTKLDSKRTNYIDENSVTDEIYNPVVAKSVRQAIKIINASIKKWGDFDKIVIEMPRDKNEEEERKRIADGQKVNAKEKEQAEKHAAKLFNGKEELPSEVFHGYKELALRIRLWYQQDQKCLYSGKEITISDLIYNRELFEIDHILPLSLSFDDSLSNKVLVYRWANQEKGQRTPFQALDSMKSAWSYREFKNAILHNSKISRKKRDYFLTEQDISKIEVNQKFIERNLVDTRYASRTVLNVLQQSLKNLEKETKVSVVRGQFTSQLRRKWHIDKTRDTYHHHAVDALIIAASAKLRYWKKQGDILFENYLIDRHVDRVTGEIQSDDSYKEEVFTPPYDGFVQTISNPGFEDEILFSYQVDSKVNRKISDATIYATRSAKLEKDKKEQTYVLGKIKDIYSQTGFENFLKIYNKDKSKFLIYQKDPETWEKIIEPILKNYREFDNKGKDIVNPFEKYRNDNGPICKYSRKGNGPEIKQFKYYDTVLGKYIEITPESSRNIVALRSLNPWRTDVYFNEKTLKYEFLGLKYSDLNIQNKEEYGISEENYQKIKKEEGVSEESIFKFTLYRNDLIIIKDLSKGKSQIFRFWSRTGKVNEKHKLELKPYNKSSFEKGESLEVIRNLYPSSNQFQEKLNKSDLSIYKLKTDILGNKFISKNENLFPKLIYKKIKRK